MENLTYICVGGKINYMTEEEKTMFSRIMSEYGKKGGTARAKNNSKSKLSDIGKMGAAVRWKH